MEKTTNLNKKNFKSDGLAKVIENALNNETNRTAFQIINEKRREGATYQSIADELTQRKILTRRGKEFKKGSVKQLYDRFLKYYDIENNKFKKGAINIKSKGKLSLGYLKILSNGDVSISTNFSPYKAFEFFLTGNNERDELLALAKITRAYQNATDKIVVSNYLHLRNSEIRAKELAFFSENYFSVLENAILNKDISYERLLNIPNSIWNMFSEDYEILDEIPLESIIIALKLMSDSIENHIDSCFERAQRNFKLFIIRIQRVYSTFASVDSCTLIVEGYVTKVSGASSPSNITIYQAKEENSEDDMYRYIQHTKREMYKVIDSEKTQIYPIKPIGREEFFLTKRLIECCEENNFNAFSIALNAVQKDNWNVNRTTKELFDKVNVILSVVEQYKEEQKKNIKEIGENIALIQ